MNDVAQLAAYHGVIAVVARYSEAEVAALLVAVEAFTSEEPAPWPLVEVAAQSAEVADQRRSDRQRCLRQQRELPLQLTLGQAFIVQKGWAAQEVERAFTHARELCERLGDPPELFPVLFGLFSMYYLRGELRTAYELAEQLIRRAESALDPRY